MSNSIVKNWYVCRTGALTVTVGLGPNVCHAAVEQIDQHESIAVQESVLAAFIARTSLEKQAHVIAYLTGYWCFHEHCKKVKRSNFPNITRSLITRHRTKPELLTKDEGRLNAGNDLFVSPYLV